MLLVWVVEVMLRAGLGVKESDGVERDGWLGG